MNTDSGKHTEGPEVVARAKRCRDGTWGLIVACPHCGREHMHGGGDGERPGLYGHRYSHCEGSPSYRLVPEVGQETEPS